MFGISFISCAFSDLMPFVGRHEGRQARKTLPRQFDLFSNVYKLIHGLAKCGVQKMDRLKSVHYYLLFLIVHKVHKYGTCRNIAICLQVQSTIQNTKSIYST